MKREAVLDYYIRNGEIFSIQSQMLADITGENTIYEVIRVIDGVALYFEEHMERMRKSAEILGYAINKSDGEVFREIEKLIKMNNNPDLNIKLLCSNLHQENQDFLLYFMKSHYPEQAVCRRGIHTILFESERENPNAKVVNNNLRQRVQEAMETARAFEALLVNNEHYITEGSRSNIFFVKEDHLITAPPGDVLLGVTRMRIMEVCKKLQIQVKEELLHESQLTEIDAAFMTGTSVNVLPIHSIDERIYHSTENLVLQTVQKGYLADMEAYIKNRKARD
ncbi:aminotransferase class IV [Geosporobacter ferrireducens]|uniref:aminotransferase class IV n=1 Tax=Geosporobacter ferrireducens TaxID=1424294 RepID=UPI001F221B4A|nr:aminotransferase class IV [Geosporobacter ferrireducens]